MSRLSIPRRLLPLFVLLSVLFLVPLVYSQGFLSITLYTDKTQYESGETVRISGKVLDSQSNPVLGAAVSIQVGDPPVHVDLVFSDNSGAYLDSFILAAGTAPSQYNVFASAGKPGYASAQQQTQFTVLPQSTSTTSSSSSSQSNSPPSKCFIATATYGSEIAPEVSLLRNFRDAEVLQTSAGRSFMQAFNAFYYSFSPQLASLIASHWTVKSAMKAILYPLIGILYLSTRIFQVLSFDEEFAVTISGIFAAFMIGVVYFGPLAILGSRLAKTCATSRWSMLKSFILGSCIISTVALILAEAGGSTIFLTATAVATVLSYLLLGAFSVRPLATLLCGEEGRVGRTTSGAKSV